jgi:serine/threonine protein phosphatase 1
MGTKIGFLTIFIDLTGVRNYWFIGDIHGEAALLERLLANILNYGPEEIVFVGDYIDRGPRSKQVVDLILDLEVPVTCLMGNHELMMLNAMEDPGYGPSPIELWYENGAEATLLSFGFTSFFTFQSAMEERYLDFFRSLRMNRVMRIGDNLKILATHAGISPLIPLHDHLKIRDYKELHRYMLERHLNPESSILWVRDDFFDSRPDQWDGYLVIHGHTPVRKLNRFVSSSGAPHFRFLENDLCIRTYPENGAIVSVDIDSGSTLSGRLSGLGFFVEEKGQGNSRVRMRSLTVSREDIFPRDLGLVR